ncbi:MAG TPA: putative Ig domain-containing protein, partial [Vicinamibacterales bacterium]|nr:putative Ig domain-containing protein [Vicinamibacterales bacterium]
TGSLPQGLGSHTATLLTCPTGNPGCAWGGKVLIAGGQTNGNTTVASAYLFDPSANGNVGAFTSIGNMTVPRVSHSATRLSNGTVLIAGGSNQSGNAGTAEIYDPVAGTFTQTGTLLTPRSGHTATLLSDGSTVLITGGQTTSGPSIVTAAAEIFSGGSFASAGTMLSPRQRHNAILLNDSSHSVLITGGLRNNTSSFGVPGIPWATAELYVPGTGFVGAPSTLVTRYDHGAELLTNGQVAIVGGNAASLQASQSFEIYDTGTVATGTPSISNANLPDGFVGTAYTPNLLTGRGGTGGYTFTTVAPGLLPPGVFLLSGGLISGTPTAAGTYYVAIKVTDANLHSNTQSVRVRINALDITTTTLPTAIVGSPYNQPLTATGVGAKTWTVISGSLPNGLILTSAGVISGSATSPSFSNFTVRAVDSLFQVATAALQLQSSYPQLNITTPSLPAVIVNTPYNQTLTATGLGAKAWTITFGSLPNGLSLTSGGTISGTPTTVGFSNFTVQATDAANQTTQRGFSIQVNGVLTITTTALPAAYVQNTYFGCIGFTGGNGALAWSISAGALPPGYTIGANNGCFAGPPVPRTGQFAFTVQAQDTEVPPQVATQMYLLRAGAPDQGTSWFDNQSPTRPIDSTHQLAQTFRQQMTGQLIAVQAPIACTADPSAMLTVDIRAVDGLGQIVMSGAPLSTKNFSVNLLPPVYSQTFTFSSPVFAPIGVHLAAVFSTSSGHCTWTEQQTTTSGGFDYAFGDGFRSPDGSVWTPIRTDNATRPDLPLSTLVDPQDALDFVPSLAGFAGQTATPLANGKVLLTGASATFGATSLLYTPATRTFAATGQHVSGWRQNHTATTLQ